MCSNLFPCLTLEDVSWYLILTVDTWGLFLPFSTGPDYARFWVTKAHRKWIILGLKCLRVSTCFWIFHYNWKLLHFFVFSLRAVEWLLGYFHRCLFVFNVMWLLTSSADCGLLHFAWKTCCLFRHHAFRLSFLSVCMTQTFLFSAAIWLKKTSTHCSILCSCWPHLPLTFYILTNKNHNLFCSFSS